ncbi:MAG: DUF1731 domain-containing protein [Planctomycetota bacterium]
MLTPFRFGLGGRIGSGRQYWSWVALEDVVAALRFAIDHTEVQGPINVTAPKPVDNREFTRVLGGVLGRPTLLPLPAFAARLALGSEMADELLLTSARVRPAALESYGFAFRHPDLEPALCDILKRP